MKKQGFVLDNINEDLLHTADKYIKKVIINTRNTYLRKKLKLKNSGIIFLSVETLDEIPSEENNFIDKYCCYIKECDVSIPVENPQLAEALLSLTEKQRSVLLRHVVLKIPISKIALSMGISQRMAELHKQRALKNIKERMNIK